MTAHKQWQLKFPGHGDRKKKSSRSTEETGVAKEQSIGGDAELSSTAGFSIHPNEKQNIYRGSRVT